MQQYLLVDLDGLLVLLQLRAVSPHFQQTFIGRTEENTYEISDLFPCLCAKIDKIDTLSHYNII